MTQRELYNFVESSLKVLVEPIPLSEFYEINHQNQQMISAHKLAIILLTRYRFVTTLEDQNLYRKDDLTNTWNLTGEETIRQEMNKAYFDHKIVISQTKVNEIISIVKTMTWNEKTFFAEHNPETWNVLNLKNGILFIKERIFIPHILKYEDYHPEIVNELIQDIASIRRKYNFLSNLPLEYNSEVQSFEFQNFLSSLFQDQKIINTIIEIFGYCLIKDYPIQKFFLFVGEGANGKSTLLTILERFLGTHNITSKSLTQILERFGTSGLYLKLANIQGDIDSKFIANIGILKELVSGSVIDAEFKGKDSFQFNNYAKIIISANKPPKISYSEQTHAFFRRLHLIKFEKIIPKHNQIPISTILEKFNEKEMSGILNLALLGLERVLKDNTFSYNPSEQDLIKDFDMVSDSSLYFGENLIFLSSDLINGHTLRNIELYEIYQNYCHDIGIPAQRDKHFYNKLSKLDFKPKRKGDQNLRYYENIEFSEELKDYLPEEIKNGITENNNFENQLRSLLNNSVTLQDIQSLLGSENLEKAVNLIDKWLNEGLVLEGKPGEYKFVL